MPSDFLTSIVTSVVAVYAAGCLGVLLWMGGEWLMAWFTQRREKRIARIEAELDRTQDDLRETILQLADALSSEAHDTRRALIRASYLASGATPKGKP